MRKLLIVRELCNGFVKVIKALTKCNFKLRCCFESSCNTPQENQDYDTDINTVINNNKKCKTLAEL